MKVPERASRRSAAAGMLILLAGTMLALSLGCGGSDDGPVDPGGNNFPPPERVVLIEHFTNANCPPCRPADEALATALGALGFERTVAIGNHMNWPGVDPFYNANPTEMEARRATFGVQTLPKVHIDGVAFASPSDVDALITKIVAAAAAEPDYEVVVTTAIEGDSIIVTGNVKKAADVSGQDDLFVVVIETGIAYRATDGANLVFEDVVRRYLPGTSGTPLMLVLDASVPFRFAAFVGNDWTVANLEAVAFVQSRASKAIRGTGSTH